MHCPTAECFHKMICGDGCNFNCLAIIRYELHLVSLARTVYADHDSKGSWLQMRLGQRHRQHDQAVNIKHDGLHSP